MKRKIFDKKVCVFLSAQDLDEKYEKPATELVSRLVENNFAFVYGGSERGLMKKAADMVRQKGGKIISVACEEFRQAWRADVDELIECANIPERKKKIIEVSDALVVLPGGTGTLDELMEVVETKKWGAHDKPIVILNSANYWDGLIMQFKKMKAEGFLSREIEELIYFTDEPGEVINYLNSSLAQKK